VWLKSVGAGSGHEARLSRALAGWVPGRVLDPIAVHADRRRSLLPDGGPTLRASGRSAAPEAWEAMLADYAQLQLDLAPHADEMVALGAPFLSLLVALRLAARALDVEPGDPVLLRLRDAYLEPWAAYGSAAELRELCAVALRVGPPARALTWDRLLVGVHPAERAEWASSVPGWMATYLEPSSLDASR
jgi:hypothetical protein